VTEAANQTRSVVIEREVAHPPEKIWRALSQPHLLEEWLMKNDFAPVVGHRFKFTDDWGSVDCEVLNMDLNKTLSYTWSAFGVATIVTWTLTPIVTPKGAGTLLRMEQSGFAQGQRQAYEGAKLGWARFLGALEQLLARVDSGNTP
jgi:uncharacterized protein YndB with AHSA1/START domain